MMRTEAIVDKRLFDTTHQLFEESPLHTRVREVASTKSNLKAAQLVDKLATAVK